MAQDTILFRSPAASYDDPLEMWQECHERVRRMCALLQRVQAHVAAQGADAQARDGATSVLRYFNEAGPRHHADEEENLFPRLLQRLEGRAEVTDVARTIEQLQQEHDVLESDWAQLKQTLQQIAQGQTVALEPTLVARYATGYQHHLELEETILAPALKGALNDADWSEIGAAMAARRGVSWAQPMVAKSMAGNS